MQIENYMLIISSERWENLHDRDDTYYSGKF